MSAYNPKRKSFKPHYYFEDLDQLALELRRDGQEYFDCRQGTRLGDFVHDTGDGLTHAVGVISMNAQEDSRRVRQGVMLGLGTVDFILRDSIRSGIETTIIQAGHSNETLRDNARGYIQRCSDQARHTKNVNMDYRGLLDPIHTAIADIYPEQEQHSLSTQHGFLVAAHVVMQMTREWDLWIDHVIGTTQEK